MGQSRWPSTCVTALLGFGARELPRILTVRPGQVIKLSWLALIMTLLARSTRTSFLSPTLGVGTGVTTGLDALPLARARSSMAWCPFTTFGFPSIRLPSVTIVSRRSTKHFATSTCTQAVCWQPRCLSARRTLFPSQVATSTTKCGRATILVSYVLACLTRPSGQDGGFGCRRTGVPRAAAPLAPEVSGSLAKRWQRYRASLCRR
mmetsp:Transcript_1070/g.3270  ORF Transcript_1070/g.3270 Transcript_1070/m.3270 type:complete len:205 (-) Transcript_1070:988-1602(-)